MNIRKLNEELEVLLSNNKIKNINENMAVLRNEIKELLSVAISDEYIDKIVDAIYDIIAEDVKTTSAEEEE